VATTRFAVSSVPFEVSSTKPPPGRRGVGVSLEIRDGLVTREKALGIVAVVGVAGQLQKQVGGVQPEAVPAARAPGLPDAALLEDHVLAAVPAQVIAGGEAGLPSADDDRVDRVGHRDRG